MSSGGPPGRRRDDTGRGDLLSRGTTAAAKAG